MKSQYSLIMGLACLFFLLSVTFEGRQRKGFSQTKSSPHQKTMVQAATDFLALLEPTKKAQALLLFTSPERVRWHNQPSHMHHRAGIYLKDLTKEQKQALHSMLRNALSEQGYLKTVGIIQLDELYRQTLSEAASRDSSLPFYGQDYYTIAIFGNPTTDNDWGWRLEGHHLSLNFTVTPAGIAGTPMFMGANPAEVAEGPYAGWQVMGAEITLARKLLASLNDRQRAKAISQAPMPDDIMTRTGEEPFLKNITGVSAADLNNSQQEILIDLIQVYVGNLTNKQATEQLEKIRHAGLDKLHFMWAGSTKPGEALYYRIHSPSFIIELDNRSYEPNHIHSVWWNLENDFGTGLLQVNNR
ncbi:MAG: DUF3500 domain-containing protein [Bacteroidota bacterium]